MDQSTESRARGPGHDNDPDIAAALERLMLAIGKEAHAQRERHGWSQDGVAKAAGVHPESVQELERGIGDRKLSTVVSVFYVLGFELQLGLRHTRQRPA